jgi:NADP-dependent 3-hydroxy acid dehydrogenase YdfG
VSLDEPRTLFETNVFGVVAGTQATLPLLHEGRQPHLGETRRSAG